MVSSVVSRHVFDLPSNETVPQSGFRFFMFRLFMKYSLFMHSRNKRYLQPDSGNVSFEETLNMDVRTQQIKPVPN